MSTPPPPMSWPVIIAILVAVSVAGGVLVGLLGSHVPLPGWVLTGLSGAIVGLVAVFLLSRRNAALGPPPSR